MASKLMHRMKISIDPDSIKNLKDLSKALKKFNSNMLKLEKLIKKHYELMRKRPK
jgi:hypothetical protein